MTQWGAFRQAGSLWGTCRPVGGSIIPEYQLCQSRGTLRRSVDSFKLTIVSEAKHGHYYYYYVITELSSINHLGKEGCLALQWFQLSLGRAIATIKCFAGKIKDSIYWVQNQRAEIKLYSVFKADPASQEKKCSSTLTPVLLNWVQVKAIKFTFLGIYFAVEKFGVTATCTQILNKSWGSLQFILFPPRCDHRAPGEEEGSNTVRHDFLPHYLSNRWAQPS